VTTVKSTTSRCWIVGPVGGNFEDHLRGFLLRDKFKVSDTSITLSSEKEEIRILIVEGTDNTSGIIESVPEKGSRHVLDIPDHVFTGSSGTKTDRNDLIVFTHPQGTTTLNSDVGVTLRGNLLLTRVNYTDLLVLRVGTQQRSVVVPVEGLNNVGGASGGGMTLTSFNIPNFCVIVSTSSSEQVLDYWVEFNNSDFTLVSFQGLDVLVELGTLSNTTVRDPPQFGSAILRTGGQDVVIERIKF
jgi:hypothetical protein